VDAAALRREVFLPVGTWKFFNVARAALQRIGGVLRGAAYYVRLPAYGVPETLAGGLYPA